MESAYRNCIYLFFISHICLLFFSPCCVLLKYVLQSDVVLDLFLTSITESLKEKVEEFFGCEYELFVEFTGLIRLVSHLSTASFFR